MSDAAVASNAAATALGRRRTPRAAELCDWLDANSLTDGGLPFALPITYAFPRGGGGI